MQPEEKQAAPQQPVKILIVEDHELTRQGLTFGLKKFAHLDIIGEAENGQEALDFLQEKPVTAVLMDIGMPVMDGIKATKQIKEIYPEVKVIMLTSHQERAQVFSAFDAGADAYCMKDIKIQRLVHVIEMVMDGAVWLDPGVAGFIMKALPHFTTESAEEGEPQQKQQRKKFNTDLTPREKDVLRAIVDGKSNQEIADELTISLFTVKNHVCNIIQKLAVDDRTQAAIKALREELI